MRSTIVNHQLATLLEESGASHAAIARQVVLLGKTEYGLRLAYDYRSVGRWLRGAVPDAPAPRLLAAVLSRTLGRDITAYHLGFDHGEVIRRSLIVHPAVTDTVETVTELWGAAVQRRHFLHTSATFVTALAIEAAMDWRDLPATRSLDQAAGAAPVTGTDVAALRQAHAEFQLLDHTHGGGYALPWLEQYLHTDVTPLLHGRYSDAVGRDLFQAASALSDMAGWMAMDMSLHGLGQRYYTQAARPGPSRRRPRVRRVRHREPRHPGAADRADPHLHPPGPHRAGRRRAGHHPDPDRPPGGHRSQGSRHGRQPL